VELFPSPRRRSPIQGTEIGATERRIAYWLGAVSLLVLTIGLANTGTLLLVRGAARRSEFMIRIALGATPGRSRSQVLLEALLLASIATAAALLLSVWLDEVVRRLLLPTVSGSAGPTERILLAAGVAGGLAFAVAILAGIGQIPRSHVAPPSSYRRGRAHVALLVFQTTVSVILLAGAGLFGRSLYTLAAQDLGMRTDDVLLLQFDRGGRAADQDERFAASLDRIRTLPGVQLAVPIKTIPFTGFNVPPIGVPGLAGPPNVNGQLPFLTAAAPDFFEILDIRIVEGRRFVDTDDRGAPVVIVNEAMARTLWPGHSALGKCIRIGFEASFDPFSAGGPPVPTTLPCREVVGVARDVRQRSVVPTGAETRLMQYFVPFSQVPPPPTGVNPGGRVEIYGLLLRATAGPEQLAPAIRRLVVGDRTDLPLLQVRRYAALLERQIRPWRLGTALLVLFGALALVVAAVGLHAAFAHSVSERRRELAIRIAIGAQPQGVPRMILREAAVFAIAGVLIGSAVVAVGGRSLESMLFGTAPTDPVVLGSVGVLMVIVAGIATFPPALRAAQADPSALLRAE
jgi:putative ABC transport system permease protein